MPLKTPKFWQTRNICARMLLSFSGLYFIGHKINQALSKPHRANIPVICVGGVVAGGSGKTPTTHAIVKLIQDSNPSANVVILSRGYGGHMQGPTQVQLGYHDAQDVGDEALLHAEKTTTIISAKRAAGIALAETMGANIVVMDDGFQNNSIYKDVSLLVLDSYQGIGNGYLLPAGPLREPLNDALKKADAVILLNGEMALDTDKPVFKASYAISSAHNKNKKYFAFAGLGYPEKFQTTLLSNGFHLNGFQAFADHHSYTDDDIQRLKETADDSTLITTEKDYARLSEEQRVAIDALRIQLEFQSPESITSFLSGMRAS